MVEKVSISPTFYQLFFCTKVYWAAFLYLRLRFVFFCQKEIGAKAASQMLVKLTQGLHKKHMRSFAETIPFPIFIYFFGIDIGRKWQHFCIDSDRTRGQSYKNNFTLLFIRVLTKFMIRSPCKYWLYFGSYIILYRFTTHGWI